MQKTKLEEIILDTLQVTTLCELCEKKGLNLPECQCTEPIDCLRKLEELYGAEADYD